MSKLTDFLQALAAEPFDFGRIDCALPLGRWWEINHGVNPAADLIGTYSDWKACAAVLDRNGSLLRLVHRLAKSVGAKRTHDPKPGDFAVVGYARLQFGAIRTPSGKWAIKCGDGLRAVKHCRPLAMWSI